MDYVFDRCETVLGADAYLAGEMYTLADIALLPYIFAFREVRPELMANHPRVKDWFERVMARPAVQATYTPSDETQSPPARG